MEKPSRRDLTTCKTYNELDMELAVYCIPFTCITNLRHLGPSTDMAASDIPQTTSGTK